MLWSAVAELADQTCQLQYTEDQKINVFMTNALKDESPEKNMPTF